MSTVSQRQLLESIFVEIFQRNFHPTSLEDRIILQKAVYLMRNLGISCGDYEFVWDKFGPFSPSLSDDMKKEMIQTDYPIRFTKEAERIMNSLKNIFSDIDEYSICNWVETIASLHYLREYMYPSFSDDQIIQKLETLKEHLRNHTENVRAMKSLNELLNLE